MFVGLFTIIFFLICHYGNLVIYLITNDYLNAFHYLIFSLLNYLFLNLACLTFVSDLQQTNVLCSVFAGNCFFLYYNTT